MNESARTALAECDDCGCVIAPSDKPMRPPGSLFGKRRLPDGSWQTTAEIFCPSCKSLVQASIPDGLLTSDVWGPANRLEYDPPPKRKGTWVSVRGFELEFHGREL